MDRAKRLIASRVVKLAIAMPLFQVTSCSVQEIQQGAVAGLAQAFSNDVFIAAQTIFLNLFRV